MSGGMSAIWHKASFAVFPRFGRYRVESGPIAKL
jgi:hypothetical protein